MVAAEEDFNLHPKMDKVSNLLIYQQKTPSSLPYLIVKACHIVGQRLFDTDLSTWTKIV